MGAGEEAAGGTASKRGIPDGQLDSTAASGRRDQGETGPQVGLSEVEITGQAVRRHGSGDAVYPLLRTLPLRRRGVSGWSGFRRDSTWSGYRSGYRGEEKRK